MTRAGIAILAALALAGCAHDPPPRPPAAPDIPKTVTVNTPVATACVDKAFPHMPAEPSSAELKALPDFAARDDQVKGHWPGLVDWATHAEAQLNLCR